MPRVKGWRKETKITTAEMYRLYQEEGMSLREVGVHAGISGCGVGRRFREVGLPVRSRSEAECAPETRKKRSQALIGRKRPPFSDEWRANMSKAQCRPGVRERIMKSWTATMVAQGWKSKGELRLFQILEKFRIEFIRTPDISFPISGGHRASPDVYLPGLMLVFEFDGHSSHYTHKGIAKDKQRDIDMFKLHGITTVRIRRNEKMFTMQTIKRIANAIQKASRKKHRCKVKPAPHKVATLLGG